jgi:LemA protein
MKKFALGCGGLVAVLLLVAVVVGMGGCGSYNGIVAKQQQSESAWAQVENQYKRRADLIPSLVETVKGAANFERSTLTEVVEARAAATQVKIDPSNMAPEQLKQFEDTQGRLSSALS